MSKSSSLTPKSPVLEKEDDEPITNSKKDDSRSIRGITPSKSEGNVARLAKNHSDNNTRYINTRDDLGQNFVSTPYIGPETSRSKFGPPPYNYDRVRDRQRMGSSGSEGSHSHSSGGQYSQHQRGDLQGRVSPPPYSHPLHSSYSAAAYKDERSQVAPGNQLNASYPGRSGQYQNGVSRQKNDNAMTPDLGYASIPRKTSESNNAFLPSRTLSVAETNNSVPRHHNSNNTGYTSSIFSDQRDDTTRRSKYPAPGVPTPSAHPRDGRGQESDSEMSSQYTPGNVRNLVQSFQKSVQVQQTRPLTPGVGGSQPREPPVPPPRRSRPVSAGPSRTNLSLSVNIRNTQRAQSVTPDYIPSDSVRPGTGRQLPARPDERKSQAPRPGSTPPRQGGTPEDKKNPNSVWYEYGCV